MTLDFVVTDQTGVWLFEPLTEEAKNFIREKVGFDECFWQAQSGSSSIIGTLVC